MPRIIRVLCVKNKIDFLIQKKRNILKKFTKKKKNN